MVVLILSLENKEPHRASFDRNHRSKKLNQKKESQKRSRNRKQKIVSKNENATRGHQQKTLEKQDRLLTEKTTKTGGQETSFCDSTKEE